MKTGMAKEGAHEGTLEPTLGLLDATAIGIGAIIGGGIFVVTGIVAGLAGPALVISIIIAGAISLLTALSFVSLTEWLPAEGSVYEFARRLISPSAGFLAGWMWVVSNIFGGAAVSLGFSNYFVAIFPAIDTRVIAVAICVIFTLLNYFGIRHSASFNNMLVLAKVLILSLFVGIGIFHVHAANYEPFVPSLAGVLYGSYFIFFAFAGFARPAVISEEVKDARRTIPRAIILSLAISTVIYIAVGAVAVGLVSAESLGGSGSPLALAISAVGYPILVYAVSFGGMLATASVLLTSILGVSRMIFAMAREGDLPSPLSRLHPRYETPQVSIVVVGLTTLAIVLFVNLAGVVGVSTFASLFCYALANASALRLKSGVKAHSKAIPIAGIVTCLMLLALVQPNALLTGLVCLAIGMLYHILVTREKGSVQHVERL